MAYYDQLVAKWSSLSGGTTDEKLAEINALTIAGRARPVRVVEVMTYLRQNNLWLTIKAAVDTSPGAAAAVDYNSDPRVQTIDVTLPIVQAMLADLVGRGLLTQGQADVITAMATPQVPWWGEPVSRGGGGLNAPVALSDLVQAGGLE